MNLSYSINTLLKVAAEQVLPEGWRVDLAWQKVEDRDAYVYQFAFSQTKIGMAHINGIDIAKLNSPDDAVRVVDDVLAEAMEDAGMPDEDNALAALLDLVGHEDQPCRFDHHWFCQEHPGGFAHDGCATARGRRALGLSASDRSAP